MHELSLVSAVIESLDDMILKEGWHGINRVTLKIGSMRQVVPDVMKFAFEVSIKGTPIEGAKLVIIPVPVRFKCHKCGGIWGEEDLGYLCPHCGGIDVEMEQGMEMLLDSLEVEE